MTHARKANDCRPTVIDLFSGAGGLSLGACRAGFSLAASVEADDRALAAHKTNFPKTLHLQEDIAALTGSALLTALNGHANGIDGVIGGPPCQGFSVMGDRCPDDPRNALLGHFFRVVKEMRPRFFLAENVPGLLSERNGAILEEALALVRPMYTVLEPMRLAAHLYGAPTTRERVFIVGYRPGELADLTPECFAPPDDVQEVRVAEALKGLPTEIEPGWLMAEQGWREVEPGDESHFGQRLHGTIPDGVGDPEATQLLKTKRLVSGCLGTRHSPQVARRYSRLEAGGCDAVSKAQRLDPKGFCPTLRAGTGKDKGSYQAVRPVHMTEDRVITPREGARLQGFPDWFQFDATKWHSFRQIGNSVSPILAEQILKVILKTLPTRSTGGNGQ